MAFSYVFVMTVKSERQQREQVEGEAPEITLAAVVAHEYNMKDEQASLVFLVSS